MRKATAPATTIVPPAVTSSKAYGLLREISEKAVKDATNRHIPTTMLSISIHVHVRNKYS